MTVQRQSQRTGRRRLHVNDRVGSTDATAVSTIAIVVQVLDALCRCYSRNILRREALQDKNCTLHIAYKNNIYVELFESHTP